MTDRTDPQNERATTSIEEAEKKKKKDNKAPFTIDKGVHFVQSQEELDKTEQENRNEFSEENKKSRKYARYKKCFQTATPIVLHYLVLIILALLTWATLWFVFGEGWNFWKGRWFRLVLIAIIAWTISIPFQALTTLPRMLAPLILGIFVRNMNFLDMREFVEIDAFLRKIYPAIILGKGPLLWNLSYMRQNWVQITCLGSLPWLAEVCTMTLCMHFLLEHSWLYGLQFGCLFATMSGPVVVPVIKPMAHNLKRKWVALIGSAGGIDVALSVGAYGMIKSYMSATEESAYLYIKLVLTPFAGVVLGTAWGYLAGVIPHVDDYYVAELRVLLLVIPGSFANFFGPYIAWGGCSGIAILVCSAVAAKEWIKRGWNHHENPAVMAYRIMWSMCEPMLFVYTGTYFVLNQATFNTLKYGILMLILCVTVRLIVASQVIRDMNWRERVFLCCCWSCKTIVQAVICPLPLIMTTINGGTAEDIRYAEQILVISIMTILIMTLTSYFTMICLGPILLKNQTKDDHRSSAQSLHDS